jgi:hypothetical protein
MFLTTFSGPSAACLAYTAYINPAVAATAYINLTATYYSPPYRGVARLWSYYYGPPYCGAARSWSYGRPL